MRETEEWESDRQRGRDRQADIQTEKRNYGVCKPNEDSYHAPVPLLHVCDVPAGTVVAVVDVVFVVFATLLFGFETIPGKMQRL